MMDLSTILLALFILFVAYLYRAYVKISTNHPVPKIDIVEYWGKGQVENHRDDDKINPFKVSVGTEDIQQLRNRLTDAGPFADPLADVAFEYGFNSKQLEKIVKYWRDDYLSNWKVHEEFLNKFPQFTTQIQGLSIHYLHARPNLQSNDNVKVFPLLLLHGWPGSVREFYEIVPLLITPKNGIAFEVVAPSLPGFGWSEATSRKGLSPEKMSVIVRNLMIRIGYEKFYVQGGDWGSAVGSGVATLFPENVLGYHANMMSIRTPLGTLKTIIAAYFPSLFMEAEYVSWMNPFSRTFWFLLEESGYFHLQATKPDTIGIALSGNPAGLAAYLLEKFSTATNRDYRQMHDGGLTKDFHMDALIDNLMIYYLSNCATSAGRIYKEAMHTKIKLDRVAVTIPAGVAHFKHEISHQLAFITSEKFKKLIHETFHSHGGHFAALQLPEVLYEDFVKFVEKTL
ncbi:juvenile hormone epoxide hydrolase 2-like [Bradysia coprophila]|uniref:juvenile hormone epoxide hydrolase 2-like n=1 Tax=Bradysia coprophila TaxID=38358 RepID=UPI00187D8834|nr:juvenile hormone epoxide hydrolase 2-like [Bradysia coprophila]